MRYVFKLRRQIFGNVSQEGARPGCIGTRRPHGAKFKVSELPLKVRMMAPFRLSITSCHTTLSMKHTKMLSMDIMRAGLNARVLAQLQAVRKIGGNEQRRRNTTQTPPSGSKAAKPVSPHVSIPW
jgi:hypothetical protein